MPCVLRPSARSQRGLYLAWPVGKSRPPRSSALVARRLACSPHPVQWRQLTSHTTHLRHRYPLTITFPQSPTRGARYPPPAGPPANTPHARRPVAPPDESSVTEGVLKAMSGEVIGPRLKSGDTGGPNGPNNPFAPKRVHAAGRSTIGGNTSK